MMNLDAKGKDFFVFLDEKSSFLHWMKYVELDFVIKGYPHRQNSSER